MASRVMQLIVMALAVLSAQPVFADSGVILESSGEVRLKLSNGAVEPAHVGKKYSDGTTVITGANAKAVVVTEFGQMFRIGPNTTVKIGERSGDSGTVSVSQGIMLALRESLGGPQSGPRAHGAVKGLGSNAAGSKMNKRSLEREIKEVEALPIESADAKAIIQGQIYYRYAEYRKAIELLEPVYRRQKNGQFLRELLVKAHENIGEHFN